MVEIEYDVYGVLPNETCVEIPKNSGHTIFNILTYKISRKTTFEMIILGW